MNFIFLLGLLFMVACIMTVVRLWQRTDIEDNTKLLWTIFIVIAPFLGLLLYYLFGQQNRI